MIHAGSPRHRQKLFSHPSSFGQRSAKNKNPRFSSAVFHARRRTLVAPSSPWSPPGSGIGLSGAYEGGAIVTQLGHGKSRRVPGAPPFPSEPEAARGRASALLASTLSDVTRAARVRFNAGIRVDTVARGGAESAASQLQSRERTGWPAQLRCDMGTQ